MKKIRQKINSILFTILQNKTLNLYFLPFSIFFYFIFISLNAITNISLNDQAADYYNAYLLSKGYILNKDFQTVFPGVVFFHSIFFLISQNLDYFSLRIIAVIYTLISTIGIYYCFKYFIAYFKIKLNHLFILNITLLFIPFYIFKNIDLSYNTMPIVLIAIIFLLIPSINKKTNSIFIGLIVGWLVLIKETFLFLLPIILIYSFLEIKRNKKSSFYILLGFLVPITFFLIYALNNNALHDNIEVYKLHSFQEGYKNKIFAIFRNFIYLIPGIILVFISTTKLVSIRYGVLLLVIFYFIFFIVLKLYPIVPFYFSYFIGSLFGGLLLYLIIQLKKKSKELQVLAFIFFIILTFIVPLGSRTIAQPLLPPAYLACPFIILLFVYLEKYKLLFYAVLPILLFSVVFQAKMRVYDFLVHQLIMKDNYFQEYHLNKLANIYGWKEEVITVEGNYRKIADTLKKDDFMLLYPRYPILYFLVDYTRPAIPKVDLETCYSKEWVEQNLDYMIKKNQIPNYVFIERDVVQYSFYKPINDYVFANYNLIDSTDILNVYLKKTDENL